MATYIKPNAIKDASIEGIKIKDGTISSSKIDETVASKSYVDTQVKTVDDKNVELDSRITQLEAKAHTHSNKQYLDEVTDTTCPWAKLVKGERIRTESLEGCESSDFETIEEGTQLYKIASSISDIIGDYNYIGISFSYDEDAERISYSNYLSSEFEVYQGSGSIDDDWLNVSDGTILRTTSKKKVAINDLNIFIESYIYIKVVDGNTIDIYIEGSEESFRGSPTEYIYPLLYKGFIKDRRLPEKWLPESVINKIQELKWSELKTLRDDSKLVPGQQYRITDYTCTTTEAKTRSAGHVFDIIVTADDESTLNEVARAALHTGDEYFSGCSLNAWKLWYCLDNDTERFDWADATETDGKPNGKGVIYRMIDEFNNDCPYDFKNIQFTRYKITSSTVSDLVGKYATSDAYNVTVDNSTPYWCYTFSTDSLEDVSLDGYSQMVYNNIIPKFHYGLSILNNIVFIGSGNMGNRFGVLCSNSTFGNNCYGNIFGNDCSRNTFGGECKNNTFGNGFSVNTFGGNCSYNTFGNGCDSNTFGGNCQQNTFGNNFRENTFGSSYGSNTFGNDCSYNTFGDNCSYNTFGNHCQHNTFGDHCYSNTFGNDCSYNTFGNNCWNNTFGNNCWNNTFGNDCQYNAFGNHCQHNTFGNNIQESQFGDGVQYFSITNGLLTIGPEASDVKSFIRWLIVENGVRYVNAYVTSSTSSSSYCQNVRICLGVQGEEVDNRKTFDITSCINSELNNVYQPANSKTTSV